LARELQDSLGEGIGGQIMAPILAMMLASAAAEGVSSMKVHSFAHNTARTKTYERPLHTVPLTSVLDYGDSNTASVAVTPDGHISQLRGESFMETGEKKSHARVHSKQLEQLRAHQREIATLIEEEEKMKAASGASDTITTGSKSFLKDAARDAAAEATWEGDTTSDADYSLEEAQKRSKSNEHQARARRSWQVDVNGVIPLQNLRDSQYVGPVGVGTEKGGNPESIINVVFDSGSTNLWIASTLCTSDSCNSRNQYNPYDSKTYKEPEEPVHLDITFGTGELRGPQGIDDLHVGPYTVKKQTFGIIEDELGEVFQEIAFEGILGLGFPSMSAHGVTPFFDNVMSQDVLKGHNEVSFFMTKLPDTASAVFFGGVDDRFFQGDVIYFPVSQEHYWSCDLLDFKVGEQSHTDFLEFKGSPESLVEGAGTGPRVSKLILDTGTTYFTAPPGLFRQVMDKLPSCDCSDIHKYPDLHYIMKDVEGKVHDVAIPPTTYMVSSDGDGWCDLSFMEIPVPDKYGPAFIFGEVFMREFYTVFNRGNGAPGSATVGFAKATVPTKGAVQSLQEHNEVNAWREAAKARDAATVKDGDTPDDAAGWRDAPAPQMH